jgi:putative FmdB family regulatory protein
MPVFEYLCRPCNRIFSFLSLTVTPSREPKCPKCGATGLERVPSTFAVATSRKAKEEPKKPVGAEAGEPDTPGGANDAMAGAMEQQMMEMMDGLDEKDAENPKVMARMMRRMAEMSGEAVTPTMDEMLRRLESGEDPEALEEELGPQLEEEMGEDGAGGGVGAPTRDDGLYDF